MLPLSLPNQLKPGVKSIDNIIAYKGASYIRDLTVIILGMFHKSSPNDPAKYVFM